MGISSFFGPGLFRNVARYGQRSAWCRLEAPLLASNFPPATLWLGLLVSAVSGRRRSPHCRSRAIFGLGDTKLPTVELVIIEPLDGVCNSRLLRERYKGEPPETTGDPVGREIYLCNVSHLRKEGCEFILGSIETQVSDKDF